MAIRKSASFNQKLLLYAQTQSYGQLRATVMAIAVAGLTAVTVPAFVLVQPAFAREAVLMVQRSLQGGNTPKPENKFQKLVNQLASLEVERTMLTAKFSPNHPSVTEINNQISGIYQQISQIHAEKYSQNQIEQIMTQALVGKIVKLEIERSQLQVNYHPTAEVIKFTDAQIHSLRRRILEIASQNPRNQINPLIKHALETKIAELHRQRSQFDQAYTLDDIEEIFSLDLQLRSLEQRLAIYV